MSSHKLDGWFRGTQKREKVEGEGWNPLKRGDKQQMDGLADRLIIASNCVNKQTKRRVITCNNFISVWFSHQKYRRRHTDEDNSSPQKRPTWFPPSTLHSFLKRIKKEDLRGIGMTTNNWAESRSTRTMERLFHCSLDKFIETRKERKNNE